MPAKKATKNTKRAAAPKKATSKATKTTKGKAASKDKPATKRRTYHDALVIFYGGALKPGHSCVTLLEGSTKKDDVMAHVYEEFSGYFGNTLRGCFVKCEDGNAALEAFREGREEDDLVDGTDFMYTMSATDAKNAAKEAANVDAAAQFKLEDFELDEEEGDEEEEDEGEVSEEEDEVSEEDEEVSEEEDEVSEEEEEEPAPAPKRRAAAKKGGAKGGARARRR
jgi:hypothetical protein